MNIEIEEIKDKKGVKDFVNFQFDLYRDDAMWVPPIKADEIKALLPETNPMMKFCKTKFWLAKREGKIVGRIGGIINTRYLENADEQIARFTRFESVDDFEVVQLLLNTAETWAKENGMLGIDGPLGFANIDHQALLIEGFEHLPSVASEYHKPYYKAHIEKLGYEKEMDWIEFRLTIPESIPDKVQMIADKVRERSGVQVRTYKKNSELVPYAKELFKLMNQAFSELFSFVHFDDDMIDFYVKKFIPILSPRFVKLIFDKEENLMGFIIALPSLSEAMQKAKGRIFPFGWYHIMKAYKNPEVIDLMLTGLHPKFQGMGYSALLMVETQRTAIDAGARYAETTGMIETNHKAIQNWKNYEHIQHKRKRCFIKRFN